jgi:hypothetical protein
MARDVEEMAGDGIRSEDAFHKRDRDALLILGLMIIPGLSNKTFW